MKYTEARQRDDGRWEYCCRQGGRFLPVGYCAGFDPRVAQAADYGAENEALFHRDGHATRQEAEACYRNYELNHVLALDGPDSLEARRCEVPCCDAMTHGLATLGHQRFSLCDAHRTRDIVAQLAGDRAGACLCPQPAASASPAATDESGRSPVVPFPGSPTALGANRAAEPGVRRCNDWRHES
jgi:hypothetical protein